MNTDSPVRLSAALPRMRSLPAAALDVVGVLIFVVLGRRNHAGVLDPAGIASTAWPFLVALLAGWVVVRAWTRPAVVLPTGVFVWIVTVAGGMGLRVLAGDGTATSFVVVATVVLGVLLVGWRGVAQNWHRLRSA